MTEVWERFSLVYERFSTYYTSDNVQRRWTWTGDFKCREVKTGFYRNRSMQTGSSGTLIGWKSGQTTFVPLWDWMEGAWLRTLYATLRIKYKTTLSVFPYLLVLLQFADSKHLAGKMVSNDSYIFINQAYKNFTHSTLYICVQLYTYFFHVFTYLKYATQSYSLKQKYYCAFQTEYN